jgi:hypothetical protein
MFNFSTTFFVALLFSSSVSALPVVYNDEASFRASAGIATTYGFEDHGVVEGAELAFSSPLTASLLDNHFDLAYSNFNAFSIIDDVADPGVVDGTHFLFTHSTVAANYTLTFSNFSNTGDGVTAFGLTITDFASNIVDPVSITYDTGIHSGTLLSVLAGQPDYTQNFIGLIVDETEAFSSITLTMNDNFSGFQSFDEIIYSSVVQISEPASLALFALGVMGLCRRKSRALS